MNGGLTVHPGERWASAVDTARSAEHYAAAMNDLLGLTPVELPPMAAAGAS